MVDIVAFYTNNAGLINFALGIAVALLGNKFALKKNIKDTHAVLEELDNAMADDNISLDEQKAILGKVKELVGEEFLVMLAKALSKK